MDDFSLILHEKLLFFGLESGAVIVFSHTRRGQICRGSAITGFVVYLTP
jgi:hypothetical protein